jgi:B12-binding domain/radical SAM domain protein
MPLGFLTMAACLDKNGFDARIYNLGKMMVTNASLDVNRFLSRLDSKIFGVDLHWCVHAQGAIEVAKLIKESHPNAFVVLGGFTATRFDKEILSKFPFVDAIIRGEAEKPMAQLAKAVCSEKDVSNVPNLTLRTTDGKIKVTPWGKVYDNLDDLEFHRYDLMEPFDPKACLGTTLLRGCPFNCITCGGSAYSCKTLLNRSKAAFRSPEKVVEDMQTLADRGFNFMGFFHDLRLGGRKYWQELVTLIQKENPGIRYLVVELYTPADREYLEKLASFDETEVILQMSPESGNEAVRMGYGRKYGNHDFLKTVEHSKELGLQMQVFFMVGLANETQETLLETTTLWKKLLSMNTEEFPLITSDVDLMVQLDPGSLAFDQPQKYGYRLFHKTFEDHYSAMRSPLWTNWMNYETAHLKREQLVEAFFQTIIRHVDILESLNLPFTNQSYLKYRRFRDGYAGKYVSEQVKTILALESSETEKRLKLAKLHEAFSAYDTLKPLPPPLHQFNKMRFTLTARIQNWLPDPYGYRKELKRIWDAS